MKKIIILVATAGLALFATAQIDTSKLRQTTSPDSTGFGTPDGNLVSRQLGVAGGSVISEDGRVELIFPSGALTSTQTISIQPTTNLAAHGTGKAYRFEPSGIQFKKPVQVIFHYNDDEAEECPPELMGFAMQGHDGKWTYLNYEDWDSTTKTLKGLIHHFSYFTGVRNVVIEPDRPTVGVNTWIGIIVEDNSRTVDTGYYRGEMELAILRKQTGWYVNGVKDGNAKVGIVQTIEGPAEGNKKGKIIVANYKAPGILPVNNPVTIKLVFPYYSKKLKKLAWGSTKCRIAVYDAYRLQIVHEFTGRAAMGSELIDSASFAVWVYPSHLILKDIKNYPPVVIKEGKKAGITEKIFTDGALGTINITELAKNYRLSANYPPEVSFELIPLDIFLYKFQYRSRAGNSDIEPLFSLSIPDEINFIANGQPQRYNVSDAGNIKYKLIITPIRE